MARDKLKHLKAVNSGLNTLFSDDLQDFFDLWKAAQLEFMKNWIHKKKYALRDLGKYPTLLQNRRNKRRNFKQRDAAQMRWKLLGTRDSGVEWQFQFAGKQLVTYNQH